MRARPLRLLLALALVPAGACGDDDGTDDATEADGSTARPDASTEGDGGADADGGPSAEDGGVDGGSGLGPLLAFPGALGFGRNATGGRGGVVVPVTNLDDSGPGSLRAALEMTGPRTVIFRVGGTIECESYLNIGTDNGDLTIAGQTAPGDGIAIRGAELRIQGSNVIVRHLRLRPGDETTGSNADGFRVIAYSGRLVEDVIGDHLSVSWAKDETVAIGGIGEGSRVERVTIQQSIIGENISTHYGMLLWNRSREISVIGNLFVHNSERSVRSSTCTSSFEMVNNVIYGYRAATRPTYENHFDVIGNSYWTNPAIEDRLQTIRLESSTGNCPDGDIALTRAHVADNLLDGSGMATISSNLDPYLEDAPVMGSGTEALPAAMGEAWVYDEAGATIPARDAVDLRLLEDARERTGGYIDSVSEVGGYPTLADGTPYPDADEDGMDDGWESSVGLDPADGADGALDRDGDGYTNLEEFLHVLTTR